MKVAETCKNYFHGFQDAAHFKKNNRKTNAMAVLKIISYFTVIIPAFVGTVWGINTLNEKRLHKKEKLGPQDERISDKARSTGLKQVEGPKIPVNVEDLSQPVKDSDFEVIKEQADRGDGHAAYRIGYYYDHAIGVDENRNLAHHYYEIAANQGDIFGLIHLGNMYKTSLDFRDVPKAFKIFKMAADKGHPFSCLTVGRMYGEGEGIGKDTVLGHKYLIKAVETSNPECLTQAAKIFLLGLHGMKTDPKLAGTYLKEVLKTIYVPRYQDGFDIVNALVQDDGKEVEGAPEIARQLFDRYLDSYEGNFLPRVPNECFEFGKIYLEKNEKENREFGAKCLNLAIQETRDLELLSSIEQFCKDKSERELQIACHNKMAGLENTSSEEELGALD